MPEEIKNRVAASKLVTLDLEDLYPPGERELLDISPWLHEGVILKEKEFRGFVKNHNWHQYQGVYLALYCSTDAILPAWAYLLVTSYASKYAVKTVVGSLELLETLVFSDSIQNFDIEKFKDKPVIIKGCSSLKIPENAYTLLIQKLLPVVKSLLYGEACSTVPLLKNK